MRPVYQLSELLQLGYFMPARLKGDRILHMHECFYEYLHSFQHYTAYKKIHTQHGVGEDLIDKRVIDHDSFFRNIKKLWRSLLSESFNHLSSLLSLQL